eukprot:g29801.t1
MSLSRESVIVMKGSTAAVLSASDSAPMAWKFIVGGNWKCNPKTYKDSVGKGKSLPMVDRSAVEVVICPPALWLTSFTETFEGLGMGVCAQNCSKTDAGAFTGEWTAANLVRAVGVDLGLQWTLLGHSERRSLYGETDEDVALKVEKCQAAGLNVILCIGEKLEDGRWFSDGGGRQEREAGKTDEVNKRQLGACLPKIKDWDKVVIAYEPVWAIGTGKVATPEQAEETQKAIRAYLSQAVSSAVAEKVRIQYGGSVNPENCAELIKQPNIDGFLVGGASLKPSFMDIVKTVGPSKMVDVWPAYESKMEKDGRRRREPCADVMLPESKLDPVDSLPTFEKLKVKPDARLLKKTLILKLNGGLGTGMGLEKAKSLLEVTEGNTFLDLIAQQATAPVVHRSRRGAGRPVHRSPIIRVLEALKKYTDLGTGSDLEFVQNKALDKLLKKGYRYMFVSNSDNLGATMDLKILTHFVQSEAPFMMEVAERTDADKKGGHLAQSKAGGLLLRESAQCPEADEKDFQNTSKYKFFNTNNLWVDLRALKEWNSAQLAAFAALSLRTGGMLGVDPRDKASTKVLQLETAMGAAIQCFPGASALVIPRSRFAPVKTTNDLLALRSDAYQLTEDETNATPDMSTDHVKLDGMYKFTDAMEKMIPNGAPSLVGCKKLVVEGEVTFAKDVVIKGTVTIKNTSGGSKEVPSGTYEDTTKEL